MELQEDVAKVLHQAPHTERLMNQVQLQMEKSTEQLQGIIGKTAMMEGAIGKIGITVDEFKTLRVDLLNRYNVGARMYVVMVCVYCVCMCMLCVSQLMSWRLFVWIYCIGTMLVCVMYIYMYIYTSYTHTHTYIQKCVYLK